MKTLIFSLLIFAAFSLNAQEVQLSNGRKTVLISIGGSSMKEDQEARILRLERAVRDLQDQVWQLSVKPPANANWYICEIDTFGKIFKSDKQNLEYDAREQAKDRCTQSYNKIHCTDVNCKKIN